MLARLVRRARRWFRSAAVAMAVMLAASAVVPAASAATPPDDYQPKIHTYTPPLDNAIELLQQYGIIRGDETGDLRLYSHITRAEMVTILIRMLGQEDEALRLFGTAAFRDTGTHWGSGYIARAQQLGLANGYPDGTFRPNNPVTYAEALALLLRTAGQEPRGGRWPDDIVAHAMNLDIVPPGVNVRYVPNNPAIRLHVFQSLFLAGTRLIVSSTGKTIFQTYVDTTPPALNVTPLPASTTVDTVTISGTAPDAVVVYVDSKEVPLSAGGTFQSQVRLVPGFNSFVIEAFDAVGNRTTQTVATTLATGPARIEVIGPTTVQPGSRVQYAVHVYDANGVDLGARDVKVQIIGNIGTYDIETHTLYAADSYATGKLIFTAGSLTKEVPITVQGLGEGAEALRFSNVSTGTVFALNQSYQIRVEVVDEDGDVVTADNGRTISLTASGDIDVTITPAQAATVDGKATFFIHSSEPGTVVLRASASGLSSAQVTVHFATARRILLHSDRSLLPPDDESEAVITAYLVDQYGNPVKWDGDDDLVIELRRSGPGRLLDDEITIPVGSSYSVHDTGLVQARDDTGTLTISGTVVDGPDYTVVPVTISVDEPSAEAGMRLEIVGPSSAEVGTTQTYTVYVKDANGYVVTSGSYAFQIAISASNDDEKIDGIPEGITVSLGDTGLNPVDDGYAENSSRDGWDVIARTKNGKAIIKLSYDRSGQVTITPVPKGFTPEAYDSDGNVGAAASTTAIRSSDIKSVTTSFHGKPHAVKLEVDSVLGKEQPGGALPVGSSATATIRARIVDENGNWVPGIDDYTIILQKESGSSTTIVGASKIDAENGYAEFKVKATSTAGTDVYSARAEKGSWLRKTVLGEYNAVAIDVEKSAPKIDGDSIIIAINGYKDGKIREYYFVGSDDDGMAIALNPRAVNGEGIAVVNVYRIEGSKKVLIYTSDVVDFDPNEPVVIYVPKSALKDGNYAYAVSLKNSRGESAISEPSDIVSMTTKYASVTISSARFTGTKDGEKNVLTVFTSTSLKCDGTIDPSKLSIVAGNEAISLAGAKPYIGSKAGENCTSSSSQSQFQLVLTDQQVTNLFDPKVAGNNPVLEAEAGWYIAPNRQMADADTTGNTISGLTYVDRVEVDFANGKLYLVGGGFNAVNTLDKTKITFSNDDKKDNTDVELAKYVSKITRQNDNLYVITLQADPDTKKSLKDALQKARITGDIKVLLDEGWNIQSSSRGPSLTRKLYSTATVSQVSYSNGTLRLVGSGFQGGVVHPKKILIKRWNGTSFTLSGAKAKIEDNGHITIQVTATTPFTDSYLFFYGEDGWWTDALGIPAYRTKEIGISK